MLPILPINEPIDFNLHVRTPGLNFLATTPAPTEKQWRGREYWQWALPTMRNLYSELCAYSCCWIPHSTGSHSIDHFIPKSITPNLAYEWRNFRYVSTRFNSRKGVQTIVDPFFMTFHWFVIDFSNFYIIPNSGGLTQDQAALAHDTINILKLNDDDNLVVERKQYYEDYINNHIDFEYLHRKAPFIAYEIRRQNLI